MKWTELQDSIAQKYCGTVLVLDDEVCTKTADAVQINPLFLNAKLAFENKGMLCDLRHIEHDFDDDARLKLLRQQWRRADTVVLDWYLGAEKQALKDPTNALEVLRDLSESGGFRFAIIQSKEDAEQILAHLRSKFPDCKNVFVATQQTSTADEDGAEILSEDEAVPSMETGNPIPVAPTGSALSSMEAPSTYRLSSSLYVSVVLKDQDPRRVVDVPFFFASGLKQAFPDHLHWVGFDFATKVRELLPRVLAVLPSGTDVALMFQALLQGTDELGDSLVECLADEVRELLRCDTLESSSDKTIIERLIAAARGEVPSPPWDEATSTSVKDSCIYVHTVEEQHKAAFTRFFGSGQIGRNRKQAQDALSQYIATAIGINTQSGTANSLHDGFGALREHYQSTTAKRLNSGTILRRTLRVDDNRNWLLCLSPACDCARGDDAREYLFVEGKELSTPQMEDVNTVQTCLAADGNFVHVKWSSKWFKTINCSPSLVEGYEFHSRLRDDFVHLLTQRVMGWQSRAGVNTSEFLRVRRERA